MIKQLRTKARQLNRDPEQWRAASTLNQFLSDAKKHKARCEESGGWTKIREVFVIAERSLGTFKQVRGDSVSAISIAEEFEDTADEMEVALEK